jgi:hypothetical protein
MGSKYSIQAWGQHWPALNNDYSYLGLWSGQSLPRALWELWKAKRSGKWGCVTLECR